MQKVLQVSTKWDRLSVSFNTIFSFDIMGYCLMKYILFYHKDRGVLKKWKGEGFKVLKNAVNVPNFNLSVTMLPQQQEENYKSMKATNHVKGW